jgi:hypothetical protein
MIGLGEEEEIAMFQTHSIRIATVVAIAAEGNSFGKLPPSPPSFKYTIP